MLTGIDLLLRAVGLVFQIYLSGRIGAAGLGLMQLVAAVGSLASTFALSGVRTAAMYLCAEEYARRSLAGVRRAVRLCLLWSAAFSLTAGAALWLGAEWAARVWIGDMRAVSGLRILALSMPATAFGGVLSGFFTACGRVRRLAAVEAVQQLISLALTMVLLCGGTVGAERACCAILAGNLGAMLVGDLRLAHLMWRSLRRADNISPEAGMGRRLTALCVPLALGDYLRSGLRTLEQLLIPFGLSRASGSKEAAMAAYGAIHGMVFPILMLPAAILYALSDLLVPELARCRAAGQTERIGLLCARALRVCIVFSCTCAALELLLAEPLGLLLYQSHEAAVQLRRFAPLIVILYPDALVDGMCKGLGKQLACVRNNTVTSVLDVAMLYVLLPRFGVEGYLLTFALTHAVNFFLSVRLLLDASGCSVRPGFLVRTAACMLLPLLLCMLMPTVGTPLWQIVRGGAIYLLLYLPLVRLLEVFTPAERRWLHRTLTPESVRRR